MRGRVVFTLLIVVLAAMVVFSVGGLLLVDLNHIGHQWATAIGVVGMLASVGVLATTFAHATQVTRD